MPRSVSILGAQPAEPRRAEARGAKEKFLPSGHLVIATLYFFYTLAT
jgi:hypothetical protein